MRFERLEFDGETTGPGRVIDRRGQEYVERDEGALHPFSPRIWWRNEQERMAEAEANRAGLGLEGLPPVAPSPRPPNRMTGPPAAPDGILTQIFDRLSRQVAGGLRSDPRDLLPEALDPLEGTIPEEFLPDVASFDWFDPTVWARADPNDVSEVDLGKITPSTGQGRKGKGMDWFRGGEAPNNLSNRHNPLYQSRREFAVQLAPRIEELFGVSAEGSAGYLRPYNASHAAPGGPSGNSDHYSGGAIDFFGDPEKLTDLRNWLVAQPFTSFVRWQSESHFDHVHVSFDLGWVAQNYFEGRSLPSLSTKPADPVFAPEAARRSQPSTSTVGSPQGGPERGVQVADDPNMNRAI